MNYTSEVNTKVTTFIKSQNGPSGLHFFALRERTTKNFKTAALRAKRVETGSDGGEVNLLSVIHLRSLAEPTRPESTLCCLLLLFWTIALTGQPMYPVAVQFQCVNFASYISACVKGDCEVC